MSASDSGSNRNDPEGISVRVCLGGGSDLWKAKSFCILFPPEEKKSLLALHDAAGIRVPTAAGFRLPTKIYPSGYDWAGHAWVHARESVVKQIRAEHLESVGACPLYDLKLVPYPYAYYCNRTRKRLTGVRLSMTDFAQVRTPAAVESGGEE